MKSYKYLIVGGGMAADSAVAGIRSVDATGDIGLIGAEPDAPYDRPPLSKALWKNQSTLEAIGRKTEAKGVTLHLGRTVKTIDAKTKRVVDDAGNEYGYEKLLLATGGRPRRLPFEGSAVIYYRTRADYLRLRALTSQGRTFAVIGGGFIGSEIAAALAMNGQKVTLIFPGAGIGSAIFPRELSAFLTGYYRKKGVAIIAGAKVSGLESRGNQLVLKAEGHPEIVADSVVAGLGLQPNIELAHAAGLTVENGVVVDEFLRTSDPSIYAAGDVAAFSNPALGQRLRVEHEDNANTMGRAAGRSMAGAPEPYRHLPFFYSDLFEFGYEAVGETDSRLETVVDWKRPNEEGVIYYLQQGRVRGVLLWNIFGQVDAARALIAEHGPFAASDLKDRLPAPTPDSAT